MPASIPKRYHWSAIDKAGNRQSGSQLELSRSVVISQLQKLSYINIRVWKQ